MTETTAERYFDTLFYNIQEIQFRTAHLDIRTKTMQYLLIAILTQKAVMQASKKVINLKLNLYPNLICF